MSQPARKVALVTGAASGIGAATAARFCRDGMHVVLTDIADDAGAALVEKLGERATYRRLDVTSPEDWSATIDAVSDAHGRLDALVHNAGGGFSTDIETLTLQQWRAVFALNVESVVLGTQAALPLMRRSGDGGSIVIVSSVAGLIGVPQLPAYGAAKAAVRNLAKTIALHCAAKGDEIRCNSIHPGFTDTPLVEKLASLSKDPARAMDKLSQAAPLRRLGKVEEVAALVAHLASDDAAFITGAEFPIDGGLTAR